MKMRIRKKDIMLILGTSILLIVTVVLGWSLVGGATLIILSVVSTILILIVLLEMYRRLSIEQEDYRRNQEYQQNQNYKQIESLFSLFFTLKPDLPFPETRGWAASPDLLKKITEIILVEKPGLVVEISSGVSTLVIAYCLKRLGKGKVISLEHDAKYASISQSYISFHGLDDIATVIYAPLKEVVINGQKCLWYNIDSLCFDKPIDLLVVDGPPWPIQGASRYPALPLLYERLSNKSSIILDDGSREKEKRMVSQWQKEFNNISSEFIDTEKGTYILRKNDEHPDD